MGGDLFWEGLIGPARLQNQITRLSLLDVFSLGFPVETLNYTGTQTQTETCFSHLSTQN